MTSDPVNHPTHYTSHPSGVECITITRHCNFNIGNAIKYLWRAGEKGAQVQDLKKAAWYIADEIKRLEQAAIVAEATTHNAAFSASLDALKANATAQEADILAAINARFQSPTADYDSGKV